MRNPASLSGNPSRFIPTAFQDAADVAECALDEQLEQLQRQHAAAERATSRAGFEVDLLEKRDDIHPHILAQARRQRAAAETSAWILS